VLLTTLVIGCAAPRTEMHFFGIVTERNEETNEVTFDIGETLEFEGEYVSLFVVGKWYEVECKRDSGDDPWKVTRLEWKDVEQPRTEL